MDEHERRTCERKACEDDDCIIEEPPRNTSKTKLPSSCVLQRTSYDRTKLFVPEAQEYSETRCSSSITQFVNRTSCFHALTEMNSRTATSYASTTLCCWNDSHRFQGPVIPLPKSFDPRRRCFVVMGCFCSFACAKRFLLDSVSNDKSAQIVLLERMAMELYGAPSEQTTEGIVAAPPRLLLDCFGGPYSIERYRAMCGQKREVSVKMAPFVSSFMVCEEREREMTAVSAIGINGISSVRGLRRPAEPVRMRSAEEPPCTAQNSPYLSFVGERERERADDRGAAAPTKPTATTSKPQETQGTAPKSGSSRLQSSTLARFIKSSPSSTHS